MQLLSEIYTYICVYASINYLHTLKLANKMRKNNRGLQNENTTNQRQTRRRYKIACNQIKQKACGTRKTTVKRQRTNAHTDKRSNKTSRYYDRWKDRNKVGWFCTLYNLAAFCHKITVYLIVSGCFYYANSNAMDWHLQKSRVHSHRLRASQEMANDDQPNQPIKTWPPAAIIGRMPRNGRNNRHRPAGNPYGYWIPPRESTWKSLSEKLLFWCAAEDNRPTHDDSEQQQLPPETTAAVRCIWYFA